MSDLNNDAEYRHRLLSPAGYVQAVFDNIWLIVAGAVIAGLAGAGAALLLPAQFSSSATLLVSPPPFKHADAMSMLMPVPLGVPDYSILLMSDGILQRAAEKVRAQGGWSDKEMEAINRISFLRKAMKLEAEVSQKTVSNTTYSPVIVLTSTADSPEHARQLVTAWAEVCEEVSREAYEKSKHGVLNFMENRFEDTHKQLETVAGEIRDMEINWNDELAKAQLAKLHTRFLDYQEKIQDRKVQIETTKKEIEELEASLASEPEFITLQKSPPMTAVYMKGSKETAAGYTEQEINDVYVTLKQKLAEKKSELGSLEEFVHQMESQIGQVADDVRMQREELASKSYDRKMLNLAETPQMRSYDLLSGMLEQAKFVESDQLLLGDIKMISEAVLPDKKSWPPRTLFVVIAGFCGFCVAVSGVLLRHALRSVELARPVPGSMQEAAAS